jgi:Mlc titration factor MtfA (ptsG expression regulator)
MMIINSVLLLSLIVFVMVYWRWNIIQGVMWNRKYRAQALSHHDKAVLLKYMSIYRNMTDKERDTLERHIIWFLGEKRILGRDGLVVDRVMELIVAADACLLVLNKPWPLYPNVKEVLLYPSRYYVPHTSKDAAGLVNYHTSVRQGESWPGGTLVLSWCDVLEGNRLPGDGHNLVFHEFAHQLDQQTGQTNGTPALASREQYTHWAKVFQRAYSHLKSHVAYQMPHVIHSYGATNEAEFFAVVTETFIEKPYELKSYDPELFSLLCQYYQFNPSDWVRSIQ